MTFYGVEWPCGSLWEWWRMALRVSEEQMGLADMSHGYPLYVVWIYVVWIFRVVMALLAVESVG